MIRSIEERQAASANDNQKDYIQYTQDFEQTTKKIEETLSQCNDTQSLVMSILKLAADFYDGDWAGILDADLTIKVWSPLWWYNRRTDGMTPNHFQDFEEGEHLGRWIDALTKGTPMIIEDVEILAEQFPLEYQLLKDNGVHTMIAVPLWKHPTGFLIVRNPRRYLHHTTLLKMMAFLAVSSVYEKRLRDNLSFQTMPEHIKNDRDVVIHMCGDLQIITSRGVLTEEKLKSPKICKLVVYLLLHMRRPASPYEIVRDLWPEDDPSKAGMNVKSLIYRLQQSFGVISDYRLIESTPNGYWINPELSIVTDLQIFEDLINRAQTTVDANARGHLLTKAMEVYRSGPIDSYCTETWFLPTIAHYSIRYTGVVNQLLDILGQAKDYVCILEYANIARKIIPENSDIYYWIILAMQRLGMSEMARNELKAARLLLTEESYEELLIRLSTE